MTDNLLVEARYIGIPEALLDGLIGFAVVFLGISILIAILTLVGFKRTDSADQTPCKGRRDLISKR